MLQATLNHDIVTCYHDLSRQLGIALVHEERRNGFLSEEARVMLTAHDEVNLFVVLNKSSRDVRIS